VPTTRFEWISLHDNRQKRAAGTRGRSPKMKRSRNR